MFFIYLLAFLIPLIEAKANDNSFISGFEDIPLYSKMYQNNKNDIIFNNEESRYIETNLTALGNTTFEEVKTFYQKTLHQLGWKLINNDSNLISFYREEDILEFQKTKKTPLNVTICLKNKI